MSRKATLQTCLDCGAWTLLGDDSDIAAVTIRADLANLTADAEHVLALAGVPTYNLDVASRLHRRHRLTAGTPSTEPVLPAHHCGRTIPTAAQRPPPERLATPTWSNLPHAPDW